MVASGSGGDEHPHSSDGDGDAGLVLPGLALQHLPLLHLQAELAHLYGFISSYMRGLRAGEQAGAGVGATCLFTRLE